MTLWDWAVAAYARPEVERLCLTLQDQYGQSVPYLLWAAWAAREELELDAHALARGAALARRWERQAIAPLREVRRTLKTPADEIGDDARDGLRAQVQAAELAAERLLLEALQAHTPANPGGGLDPAQALRAAGAAWDENPPLPLLDDLAAALSNA